MIKFYKALAREAISFRVHGPTIEWLDGAISSDRGQLNDFVRLMLDFYFDNLPESRQYVRKHPPEGVVNSRSLKLWASGDEKRYLKRHARAAGLSQLMQDVLWYGRCNHPDYGIG